MKLSRRLVFSALLIPSLLMPGLLMAGGGDDHQHGPESTAPAAPTAQVLRTEATSELFELVAVLEGDKLVIHLDRFASNEPVTGAKVSVEGGPLKAVAATERDGTYTVPAAVLAAPGTHALLFTIQAGQDNDLLNGDLVVTSPAAAAAHADGFEWRGVAAPALGGVLVVLALGAGAFAWRRRRRVSQAGAL